MDSLTFTVPELAEALQISRAKAWSMVAKGELPSFKVGKLRRIEKTALDRYIKEQTAHG